MFKRIKSISLFKNSAIYGVTNIVNAAIPFALLPILTRYLGPTEYGRIAMYQTFVGLLGAFVGLSVAGAASRKYYDKDISTLELSQFIGTCLQILIASVLIVLIVVLLFSRQLESLFGLNVDWLLYALLFSTMYVVIQIRLSQWQVRESPKTYSAFQISLSCLNVGLSLLLAIGVEMRAEGRVIAQVISCLLFGVLAICLLRRDRLLSFFVWRPLYVKEALKFGVPLVPHMSSAFLIGSIDRIVINKQLGIAEAGIYMVAIQLAGVADLIFDAINKAYVPWLYERLKRDEINDKILIVRGTYLWFAFLAICGLIVAAVGPFIVFMMAGAKYQVAGRVLRWLIVGQIFNGMYYMVTNYIFYSKRTSVLSIVTFSSGLINFGLLLWLVKTYGTVGAGMAYCMSATIQFVFTWVAANRMHPMPWTSWRLIWTGEVV